MRRYWIMRIEHERRTDTPFCREESITVRISSLVSALSR
jgi:hypothetical protein